jgi:hypothetical protein
MGKDLNAAPELKLLIELDGVKPDATAKSEEAAPDEGAAQSLDVLFPPISAPSAGPLAGSGPPPIPHASGSSLSTGDADQSEEAGKSPAQRRAARRRPAGPMRGQVAANDDAPSIGGLIYALDQQPSMTPIKYARIASAVWAVTGLAFFWMMVSSDLEQGSALFQSLAKPTTFLMAAAIIVPIAVLHFLAILAWRAEELRMRSSTMTEVAVRLAEPDRMAEQSVASLGQAVRRQVSFMNDAVSRALGRAGELEALVHNEVSALERSYADNERKIRGLIAGLAGEREALVSTSDRVSGSLSSLGNEIPTLIDKLSNQQIKLAQIIQGAGDNLTALESAVGQSAIKLETTLGERTDHLQGVLESYTGAIGNAIGQRTDEIQGVLDTYTHALADALGSRSEQLQFAITEYMHELDSKLAGRSENMQAIFEEYGRALDSTLANRAQFLDVQLVERTRALDHAFNDRLRLFDESIMRSTLAIDTAVNEKAETLTRALEVHAKGFSETVSKQTMELDESLVRGINSVRRSSENITRQSLKAIEGLAGQSELLRSVSENLLGQINTVTSRFDAQGQSIMKAANSLEAANYKIDSTLQVRHSELNETLDRMSGKADEMGRFVQGYSSTMEGSLSDVESRVRSTAEQLRLGAEATKRAALADLDQIRSEADAENQRALEDLRKRASTVSNAVSQQLQELNQRFDQGSEEVRQRAQRTAAELAAEQARLKEQFDRMPMAARESTEQMRTALQDQLRALEQLSSLSARTALQREVALPVTSALNAGPVSSITSSYSNESRTADQTARRAPVTPPPQRLAATPPPPPPARPAAGGATPPLETREGWKLGELLARASFDDESGDAPNSAPDYQLNIGVIARAIDPATTGAIWSRLRSGHRNVMVRSIYSADGRLAFDEVSRRYKTDAQLQQTVERYLADFESIKADAERRDPTGRMVETHLVSDSGRVYLFLAHASGRAV